MLKQLRKYKNIIILFIIIILFLIFVKEKGFKKLTERFENANLVDVLNGLDIQDQKLNDMVSKIDTNTVTFNKNINTNGNISAKSISLSGGISVKGNIDNGKINIGGNGTLYIRNGSLCIGKTCINEEHLKLLTGKKHFFLQSSGKGDTILSNQKRGYAKFVNKNRGNWEKMKIKF